MDPCRRPPALLVDSMVIVLTSRLVEHLVGPGPEGLHPGPDLYEGRCNVPPIVRRVAF